MDRKIEADAETHRQTLCRARGTSEKKGIKDDRSHMGRGHHENIAHRIN